MSYLIAEILISLIVIAIIGGVIGWMMRGVGHGMHDDDLERELAEKTDALARARQQLEKLGLSIRRLHHTREQEKEAFDRRIKELEPLFGLVEQRDTMIRRLRNELDKLKLEKDTEVEALRQELGTRNVVDDETEMSGATISRLQYELKLAARQKDSAIGRYQEQMRRLEALERDVQTRDERIATLEGELRERRGQSESQFADLEARIHDLRAQIAHGEEEHGQELERLRTRIEQTHALEQELAARDSAIEELRAQLAANAAAAAELEQTRALLRERDGSIEALEERLATGEQRLAELEELRTALVVRDAEAARLAGELEAAAARSAELERARADIEHRSDELDAARARLESALAERDAAMNEFEAAIAERDAEIRLLQSALEKSRSAARAALGANDAETLFPMPDVHDDLKTLRGVGPAMERSLNRLGITTLRQLAELSEDDVDQIGALMPQIKANLRKYRWKEHAAALMEPRNRLGTA